MKNALTLRRGMLLLIAALLGGTAGMFALQQDAPVQFSNIAASAGIQFKHENGVTPEKYLPETMSAGALFFDYDNDGLLDIFLVNGGSFSDAGKAARARHRLYRNTGGGMYRDVTASSGIEVSGFGMGACSADYDNDGWADLYVTSVGGNRLYHNTGKNGFADVTLKAGVAAGMWSSSCAFGDIDNDGFADLYVTRYVDFAPENNKYCRFDKLMAYCHPNVYSPMNNILYRNSGDGTFTDNSRESGIGAVAGNGLGVVFGDYDNDGWSDIYSRTIPVPAWSAVTLIRCFLSSSVGWNPSLKAFLLTLFFRQCRFPAS